MDENDESRALEKQLTKKKKKKKKKKLDQSVLAQQENEIQDEQ
jgi:hypothetical protein|tara:strand:- start:337 stop:465 length:129 start_codon:yes stop_codon:yes gene_type:complete